VSGLKSAAVGGVAGIALAAAAVAFGGSGAGSVFNLGVDNTVSKTTTLRSTSAFTGPQLQVKNTAGGPALNLQVNSGKPPLTVGSQTLVPTLNADLLDGYPSTHFLAAGAKATDADKLDGIDSTGFMHGDAEVVHDGVNVSPGATVHVLSHFSASPQFAISYGCPSNTSLNGDVYFENDEFGSGGADIFTDNGGADPLYQSMPDGDSNRISGASATGEFLTIDAHWSNTEHVTVWLGSVHLNASYCHVQTIAVIHH
jgi:hypothetical protein